MMKSFFYSYWKTIIATIVIMYLSFAKPSTFKEFPTFHFVDKVVHGIMYSFFSGVIMFDFLRAKRQSWMSTVFVVVCIVFPIIFGGFIEIMQGLYFKPRSAEWGDWFMDIFGVMLALGIFNFFIKSKLSIK